MSEHTPGPWEVCYSGKYPGIDHSEGSLIIFGYSNDECGIRGECRERRLADAHLIAAAPLMYEALESLVYGNNLLETMEKARAALQAAKGGENA